MKRGLCGRETKDRTELWRKGGGERTQTSEQPNKHEVAVAMNTYISYGQADYIKVSLTRRFTFS